VAFPAGIGFIDHPNSPRASAKGKSMTDQSNPRSQPVRMGEAEPSLEDQIRQAARTNAAPTIHPATEAAQKVGLSSGSTADDYMHDYTDTDPPLPSMATPRNTPGLEPFKPPTQLEQSFHSTIDDVNSETLAEIEKLEKELQEMRMLLNIGAATVKTHVGHYFHLAATATELTGNIHERLAVIRKRISGE
jgi:hypothetical protein